MKRLLPLALCYFFTITAFAQGTYVPLGGDTYDYIDRIDIKYGRILPMIHTSTKPYLRSETARMTETLHFSNLKQNKVNEFQLQYLMDDSPEWLDSVVSKTKRPLWRKLYREPASFAHVESKKKGVFDLRVNPVIDVHVGAESQQSRFIFNRAAGVEFRGNIKKVFSFYCNVTGNDARMPMYVSDKFTTNLNHDTTGVGAGGGNHFFVPGAGYFKIYSSKLFKFDDGVDWWDARGYVNINVLDYLNITFGRDKHFWGDGQRSLFLSDNSAPMLFLKYKLTFWRIEYVNMITQLISPYSRGYDGVLDQKYGIFHKLDFKISHWLNIGLFEATIARRNGNNLDPSYLNPIIFFDAVQASLGNPDNELIGGYFKANAANHLSIYGQILLDEFNVGHIVKSDGWRDNKYGVQLGLKYVDIVPTLDGQIEFNAVRPFMYSHGNEESYDNYNQPLGHPLGANFYEFLVQMRYQPLPKLTMKFKVIIDRVGDDTLMGVVSTGGASAYSNFGGDIFRTDAASHDYGNSIGQGAAATIAYFDVMASYQIWHNINFDAEMYYRDKISNFKAYSSSSFYFGVGVRLNIASKKYEF